MSTMKKKITFAAMGILLLLCLSACGKEKEVASENSETVVESETVESKTTESKTTESGNEIAETQAAMAEDVIPTDYAAAIIVTINPQVKLYVDVDNTIVGIEYLNEDAKTAYAVIDFSGLTVEEGMEQLIDAAVEKEFLTDGKEVSIDVAEVRDESYDCEAACAKAKAAVTETTQKCQLEVVISTEVSAREIAERQAAESQNVSKTETESGTEPGTEPETEPETESGTEPETESGTQPGDEPEKKEEIQASANPCSNCGGTGKCDECLGDGYRGTGFAVSCPRCHGSLTETCAYCDAAGNSNKHEGTCDFPNCMGAHVYACTTCKGGSTPVTCESCGGTGKCKVCGGSGIQ